MYDIIGDIHGHALPLEALLKKMGYRNESGAYRHPERKALFLGDYIDRGPAQLSVLSIVRSMVEADTALAIMGNHEFNAVAFATPNPDKPGQRLRVDSRNNRKSHLTFLEQLEEGSDHYYEAIEWFKTLPVFLDLEGIRAVHACWHPEHIEALSEYLNTDSSLNSEGWIICNQKDTLPYRSAEVLLKGVEIDLPNGITYKCKDGITRHKTRTRWWDKQAKTYRDLGMGSSAVRAALPETEVSQEQIVGYDEEKLLFFGHYWLSGAPTPLSDKIACLDYSIGKGDPSGKLVAYRWEGEETLSADNFVWADAQQEIVNSSRRIRTSNADYKFL